MSNERIDVLAVKRALGIEGCRDGSRAVGHSGPENDDWEDYIEVPVEKLAAVAELIECAEKLSRIYLDHQRNPAAVGGTLAVLAAQTRIALGKVQP